MDFSDFDDVAAHQGWTPATQVDVLEEYVDNQCDDAALIDFLAHEVEEEGNVVAQGDIGDLDDAAGIAGWDEDSRVVTLLEYIERQKSPEAFADFLQQKVHQEKEMGDDQAP